jgi:hypothetical protein
MQYHLVHRALTAAWRDAGTVWDRATASDEDRRGAAVALWRMAMLLAGIGSRRGAVFLTRGRLVCWSGRSVTFA